MVALTLLWIGGLSCGESTAPITIPARQPDPLIFSGLTGLLSCPVTTGESAVATIGPEGGTLTVGAHVLRIPAGALTSAVTISAAVPAGNVVSIVLQPEGLQFQTPAQLTLSYAECGVLHAALPKRIAYTTDELVILSFISSWDNLLARRVTGSLDHFSTYAVAW
jgi:hypothetical protein